MSQSNSQWFKFPQSRKTSSKHETTRSKICKRPKPDYNNGRPACETRSLAAIVAFEFAVHSARIDRERECTSSTSRLIARSISIRCMPNVANIDWHAGLTEISPNIEICSTVVRDVHRHPLIAPSANAPSRFRESIDKPFDPGTAHKQLYSAVSFERLFARSTIMSFYVTLSTFNRVTR